jgi:hypothetical protein
MHHMHARKCMEILHAETYKNTDCIESHVMIRLTTQEILCHSIIKIIIGLLKFQKYRVIFFLNMKISLAGSFNLSSSLLQEKTFIVCLNIGQSALFLPNWRLFFATESFPGHELRFSLLKLFLFSI